MEANVSQGFLRLKDGVGVSMKFDEVLVAIVASIPAESKKQQPLRARSPFDPSTRTITPPSALSAYLNARGSQDYVEHPFPGQQAGRLPFRMSADGAVNQRGWVLEASADYVEEDPVRPVDPQEHALTFASGTVSAVLGEHFDATLFYGKRRGGLACTAGTCYKVEPFKGTELRLSSRF